MNPGDEPERKARSTDVHGNPVRHAASVRGGPRTAHPRPIHFYACNGRAHNTAPRWIRTVLVLVARCAAHDRMIATLHLKV
jgi:hypothetical protein